MRTGTREPGQPGQSVWTVQLLGVPEARCGNASAHLRSKKTWGVLACLLLPPDLLLPDLPRLAPVPVSRETLAERFWDTSPSGRASLCMALSSLRHAFGAERFLTNRSMAQAAPDWFVTDIAQIITLQGQALAAPAPEERLRLLAEAAALIRGEFLEGCFRERAGEDSEDEADAWRQSRCLEIQGRLADVLLCFARELEHAGQDSRAFEVALRLLHQQPHHPQARALAWTLAQRTGQTRVVHALDAARNLEEALARTEAQRHTGRALSPKDQQKLDPLVREELDTFAERDQRRCLRLAFLPAPFSPEVARAVCRVPSRLLSRLAKTPLLEALPRREGAGPRYAVPAPVRDYAQPKIPTAVRRQMEKRLAAAGEQWLAALWVEKASDLPPLGRMQEAGPFLTMALDWNLRQPPTPSRLDFLNLLWLRGLPGLKERLLPYLEETCESPTHPAAVRVQAGIFVGRIRHAHSEFSEAVCWLQKARTVLEEAGPEDLPDRLQQQIDLAWLLVQALHYAGNSRQALVSLAEAAELFANQQNQERIADCLRFRCEILNHLGELEPALAAVEKALQSRRQSKARGAAVADALFWKATTLLRLKDEAAAAGCLTEALDLWQETGDRTGVGHCLRELGALRAAQGLYAEGRAHLEHAITLHESAQSQGCRIAAVAVLADVFLKQGRFAEARARYTECLADSEARGRAQSADLYRARLAACVVQEQKAVLDAASSPE